MVFALAPLLSAIAVSMFYNSGLLRVSPKRSPSMRYRECVGEIIARSIVEHDGRINEVWTGKAFFRLFWRRLRDAREKCTHF